MADFFKDAGHADEDGGPEGGEGLGKMVERRAVGDGNILRVESVVEMARGDVREGKEGDAGVSGVEAELVKGVVNVVRDVAMGEQDAFGLAGGARSVDEGGKVVGLNLAGGVIEGGVTVVGVGIRVGDEGGKGDALGVGSPP